MAAREDRLKFDKNFTAEHIKEGDIYFPSYVSGVDDVLQNLNAFVARPTDVWIVSYPKSGSHWLWEMLTMMVNGTTEYCSGVKHGSFLDVNSLAHLESLKSPRVLTSHVTVEWFPSDVWGKNCRIIHVYRNVKDVIVSHYNFERSRGNYVGSFDEFLETKATTELIYGGWYRNVLGWYNAQRHNPNVMFVAYEMMKKNPLSVLSDIRTFLNIDCDDSFLKEVVEKTSFEVMSRGKPMMHFKNNCIYRKGVVGDWRHSLSQRAIQDIDVEFKQKMSSCDLPIYFDISEI